MRELIYIIHVMYITNLFIQFFFWWIVLLSDVSWIFLHCKICALVQKRLGHTAIENEQKMIRTHQTINITCVCVCLSVRLRVLGSLQNFPEFANVYGCNKSSYMVSEKVCRVWWSTNLRGPCADFLLGPRTTHRKSKLPHQDGARLPRVHLLGE